MKIRVLFLMLWLSFSGQAQLSWQGNQVPNQTDAAVLLFDAAGTSLSNSSSIFAHVGVTLNGSPWQQVIGQWSVNSSQPELTHVSGTIFKLEFTPSIASFFNVTSGSISKINIVLRNATSNLQTADLEINVGSFHVNLVQPSEDSSTLVEYNGSLQVVATNTGGMAQYELKRNSETISSASGQSFNYQLSNVTENATYELYVSQGTSTFIKRFSVMVVPEVQFEALPSGMQDGLNFVDNQPTSVVLVLDAPHKDFVYVAGSFNQYLPTIDYAMKKDPNSTKFWLQINDLDAVADHTYQYWVGDLEPIQGSPFVVKVADPYSTMVLSPFDDSYIPTTTFPDLPPYPTGQEREVSWFKTGQMPYQWSDATLNFVKPMKDNLVVYEVLIRDFDADRNFQSIINRIDYFKNLNINAIQLMPIMEFEGNESWGYNTSFHLALDKFYGTPDKFKELVDVCHQNGIAVILDVALNHAFGRNPMVRMWMQDPDGDGWGEPSSENPYFNTTARHSYNVGSDFNHQSAYTQYYTQRVIKHWIEEYKIDGFRWDLTKGFTQNCSASNEGCTNAFQQDRVDVLKMYADYSWSLDEDHYVIFEHLGSNSEEQIWANYRYNEGKGIMLWGELFHPYKQLMQGYSTDANITGMGHLSRGFQGKRLLGYAESHDKDRLMYEAITYGVGSGTHPVNNNLNNALKRMRALGAVSLLIPGPKMIWHFAELGMNQSIYTCSNGTVNTESDSIGGDCKLDTKPQPQWNSNWTSDPLRSAIYQDWARFNELKLSEPVFNGNYTINPNDNNLRQRIYIWDDTLPTNSLKNVVIASNFSVGNLNVRMDFPYTGTWYNLMDNTELIVTDVAMQIPIESGGYRIYGNRPTTLDTEENTIELEVLLYPNPTDAGFMLSGSIANVSIYSLTGQCVAMWKEAQTYYDVSFLNSGIYLVKMTDSFGRAATVKLVVK